MSDSPERDERRAEMDKAVRKYVELVAKENGLTANAVLLGWAGFAEYTSVELESEDSTGRCTLVPDGQAGSMTRGLMHFGVDAFSQANAV